VIPVRWRVVKRIPFNEVISRMEALEKKYDGDLSLLHDDFLLGRLEQESFDDYVEWSGMNHALMAYGEGEDFEYFAEMEVELKPEEYERLTPRRLELLAHLSSIPVSSINDLATKIGRDVKNVYFDLKILEELGFIIFVKEGRGLRPEVLVQEISLLLI
jgi:hypothetical protein